MNYRWHRLQSPRDPCFPPQRSNAAAFLINCIISRAPGPLPPKMEFQIIEREFEVQRWRDYKPKVNYGCSVRVLIPVWVCVFDHIYWIAWVSVAHYFLSAGDDTLHVWSLYVSKYVCASVTSNKRTICGHTLGPGQIPSARWRLSQSPKLSWRLV